MVTPQVPGGSAIGQAILDDDADSQILNAAGVQAVGQGKVSQVGGAAGAAITAAVFGEGDDEVDRDSGAGIAEIVEGTGDPAVAAGPQTTMGTGTLGEVAGEAFDPGLGQVFDAGDAFRRVRNVVARRAHGGGLHRGRFHRLF